MARNLTPDDLKVFQRELLAEFKKLLAQPWPFPDPNEYLRTDKACSVFGISANTLRTHRHRSGLPFIRVGRTVYYHRDDIRKIMESNKNLHLKK